MLEICINNFLFKNLSFKSNNNRICIIGVNGSGKTTLLRCILGLEKYYGKIDIDREKIDISKCSFLFSGDNLGFEELTLKENLEYYLKLLEIDLDKDLYSKLIVEFNIHKYENYLFKNVSEGTKQKLRLVIILLQKNELIILDEPTNYLDSISIDNFINYINMHNEYKFIISSNDKILLEKINGDFLILGENKND